MTTPRMPRPLPPSMRPLSRWQWFAGIVAGLVLLVLLVVG